MKGKRQEKILEIIRTNDIETQEELTKNCQKQDFLLRREPFREISAN